MKTTPLLFPDLCTLLFDGIAITGADSWGPSSGRVMTSDNNVELEDYQIYLLIHPLPVPNHMLPVLTLKEIDQRKELGIHQSNSKIQV